MGSPVICPKHGRVFYVATSPMLAKAVSDGGDLAEKIRIVTLEVDSREELGKATKYFFEQEFLAKFSLVPVGGLLTLKDRSKREKLMNDRLMINEIFAQTVMVCPDCLNELVRRHQERTEAN